MKKIGLLYLKFTDFQLKPRTKWLTLVVGLAIVNLAGLVSSVRNNSPPRDRRRVEKLADVCNFANDRPTDG